MGVLVGIRTQHLQNTSDKCYSANHVLSLESELHGTFKSLSCSNWRYCHSDTTFGTNNWWKMQFLSFLCLSEFRENNRISTYMHMQGAYTVMLGYLHTNAWLSTHTCYGIYTHLLEYLHTYASVSTHMLRYLHIYMLGYLHTRFGIYTHMLGYLYTHARVSTYICYGIYT
jgi:hypothetical protein